MSSKVAVAIDKDKGSQIALKWAVDNLLGKGKDKSVTLLHVKCKSSLGSNDNYTKELFLPFRCFCTRKDIQVHEIVVEDADVARGICNYANNNLIENLVVGTSAKNGLMRTFKNVDFATSVSKGAPDFCNVYIICKGKVVSERPASSRASTESLRHMKSTKNCHLGTADARSVQSKGQMCNYTSSFAHKTISSEEDNTIKSPLGRNGFSIKSYGEMSIPDSDISFVSSGRPSTDRLSTSTDHDFMGVPRMSCSSDTDNRTSTGSDSFNCSWSGSQTMEDVEAEMRRLKQELKQTMDMYSTACKEAATAKQKVKELQHWKLDGEHKIEEAQRAEEAALVMAAREREKCKAAMAKAEEEEQKRKDAEMKAMKEAEEREKILDRLTQNHMKYRKYTIEEIELATENFSASLKIGEGGYGPVYKCSLDHTEVAVKALHPNAVQGRSQFQQEVEVLSCIRHPNMVLLLGACSEYGCLVYEYMANGSLDDRLFRRGNTPALSWQVRFRISAEITTALHFLHQTKPEPLVHRDLKPSNILLDSNFVSKISDVGLARLVPATASDSVTEYHMTAAAGTFCYIDPEYQQTGLLGIKSDTYSLGVMLLQIITAKPPMGLTHQVQKAIDNGTFSEILDPQVPDWPVEEALSFAKMALRCVELRRKDRPDLGSVVLPELKRLGALAEESMPTCPYHACPKS